MDKYEDDYEDDYEDTADDTDPVTVLGQAMDASWARGRGIQIETTDTDDMVRALRHVAGLRGYAIAVKRYPDHVAFKVMGLAGDGGDDE